MKKLSILFAVFLLSSACSPVAASAAVNPALNVVPSTQVPGPAVNTTVTTASAPAQSPSLTKEEQDGLLFMREEEKLAHDVYIALSQKWNMNIFGNISQSETTHTNEVITLLTAYQVSDPAAALPAGQFSIPELQALYTQLVTRGSQSLAAALKVGAAIEEMDIRDLKARLLSTDKTDIRLVYENLLQGSYNHLRSFVSVLQQQTGEVYTPQYLTAEEYQQIINASAGNSVGGQGRGGSYGRSR